VQADLEGREGREGGEEDDLEGRGTYPVAQGGGHAGLVLEGHAGDTTGAGELGGGGHEGLGAHEGGDGEESGGLHT